MKRAIPTAIFLLFTVAVVGQQAFRLVAPDKSFEVSFPVEPKHDQHSSDSGPIHVEAHSYSCENSDWKFVLTYADLSPAPTDLRASDALESAVSGTIDNVGGKLLTQESVTVHGEPAKAVTISVGSNTLMDGRFVYVKPRVYQLVVLHHRGAKPLFEQRFFDSFSVLK